jgi:hypothetical protein
MTAKIYVVCDASDIPAGVRFDVPRRLQGQTVEVAYGGFDRAEHDDGDPYKRVTDRSIGPKATTYYRAR